MKHLIQTIRDVFIAFPDWKQPAYIGSVEDLLWVFLPLINVNVQTDIKAYNLHVAQRVEGAGWVAEF